MSNQTRRDARWRPWERVALVQGSKGWGQLFFAHSFPWQSDRQNLVQNTHLSTPPDDC